MMMMIMPGSIDTAIDPHSLIKKNECLIFLEIF